MQGGSAGSTTWFRSGSPPAHDERCPSRIHLCRRQRSPTPAARTRNPRCERGHSPVVGDVGAHSQDHPGPPRCRSPPRIPPGARDGHGAAKVGECPRPIPLATADDHDGCAAKVERRYRDVQNTAPSIFAPSNSSQESPSSQQHFVGVLATSRCTAAQANVLITELQRARTSQVCYLTRRRRDAGTS